jgi:LEA14-like dessication related protein
MQNITVGYPKNYEVQQLSLSSIKLKIFLPIENPNNFSITIKDADLDLFVNNFKAGKINNVERLKINANSSYAYPIIFEISTKETLSNLLTLYKAFSGGTPELRFKGNIKASSFGLTKKIKVNHVEKIYR